MIIQNARHNSLLRRRNFLFVGTTVTNYILLQDSSTYCLFVQKSEDMFSLKRGEYHGRQLVALIV